MGEQMSKPQAAILHHLSEPFPVYSAAELCKMTRLWSGRLYPALMELEERGLVRSAWVEGPDYRLRKYWKAPDA